MYLNHSKFYAWDEAIILKSKFVAIETNSTTII